MRQQVQTGPEGPQETGKARRRDRDSTGASTALLGHPRHQDSLPVFLFPAELVFFAQQRSSHRRVLTLYNPYSFLLRFKMLCTAPSLYTVVEAEGSVRARSCVDIVVRHQDVSSRNWGRRDRFRLEVSGGGQGGSREIWAELKGGEGGETPQGQAPPPRSLSAMLPQGGLSPTRARDPSLFALYVIIGLVCITFLMLPLHNEPSTLVPTHLHVTVMQKLVCAYILGLLTMVFLR
ncbi:motile sperm domain-containing protein 1-like [Megalops cyprinoides]|uniref:motile sperm domain-containing protein 1-like n=1 Tax=Megalops cyprinoides TaxID=118141 RepID=UPI001863CC7E|nr:motile sperm domain-containing protein 1-like [Megalops cyprinoides]